MLNIILSRLILGPVSVLLGRVHHIVTLHSVPRRARVLLRPTRLLLDGGKHPSLSIMGSFIVLPMEGGMRFRPLFSKSKLCEDEASPGGGSMVEFAREPWLKTEIKNR